VVQSHSPFVINECFGGTGGRCGAEYLNESFERLIRNKVDGQKKFMSSKRLNEQNIQVAMDYFDLMLKRQFNPLDPNCGADYFVPITGAKDKPSVGLKNGFLELGR
jgi:hypothetical protein